MADNNKPIITSKTVIPKCIKHELFCPKCGAVMKFTGEILCSNPVKYPHICSECNYKIIGMTQKYPYIETIYEEID